MESGKLESVQALRGFAALLVFLFHAKILIPLWSNDATAELLRITNRGFIGVDIFFVISGFIMAWVGVLSGKGRDGCLAFAVKRVFRVAPPYWIATFVSLYLLVTGNTADELLKSMLFYPLSTQNPPFYGYPLLNVGWTLNFEMLFYAIFCCALLFGRYALVAVIATISTLVIGVPIFTGDGISFDVARHVSVSEPYLMLATNPILLEFILGIACAVIYSKVRGKTPIFIGGVLLTLGVALMAWTLAKPIESGMQAAIPAAVLLLGFALAENAGMFMVPRFATWLGEISFSFYLVHAAVVQLFRYKVPPPLGSAGTYGQMVLELGVTLMVASCFHRFVESPSARIGVKLSKRLNRIKPPANITRRVPKSSAR